MTKEQLELGNIILHKMSKYDKDITLLEKMLHSNQESISVVNVEGTNNVDRVFLNKKDIGIKVIEISIKQLKILNEKLSQNLKDL